MREIIFKLNEDTGKMDVEIEGVQGPACEQYLAMVEEYVGKPTTETKKAAYRMKTTVKQKAVRKK